MRFLARIRYTLNNKEEKAVSRRCIMVSNCSTNVVANLIGGNFLTGFLLLLNADDAIMGLVTMAAFAGNMLQVLSPLLLESFPSRKKILISARCAIYVLNVVLIGIVPFLNFTDRIKLTMIIIIILLVNILSAMTAPGFSVWHIKNIPENTRANYFSFFSIINGIVVYTIILAGSSIVDYFKASGRELQGLLVLRIVALVFCTIDIIFMFKIKEHPNERNEEPLNLKNVIIAPFKCKKYLVTVLIGCMWNFAANIPGPYFTVYLLKDIKVHYSYLNMVNMLNVPILLLLTPLWKKRIQRTTWFRTLYFSMGIYSLHYIGLSFVSSKTFFLHLLFTIYAFAIAPGINLTFLNIPYINVPEKNQTNFIGFYSAMNNFAALMGATVGREFITRTESLKITLLGMQMQNKQYLLILTSLVMLVSTILIYFLQKERKPQ
ncbi:MAG TPA: hypothetical protein GXX14_00825 [Clostridiaceae bacterium]|nr:hypothetical protein [Clostridiaceae bacterium]